jgi:hemerythrin-like domain-containing protein
MKKLIDSLLGDAATGADDIRAVLRRDHEELLELAEALCEGSGGENRKRRFAQFKELLGAHSRSEEIVVYRFLERVGDAEPKEFALEGTVEHGSVDSLVAKLSRMRDLDGDKALAHFKVIKEMLEHHIDEEHSEMFKQLGNHFSSEELAAMADRFEAAKAAPGRRRPSRARATATA